MNIALIGYGKMGHMIEQVAISRGHRIVSIIDVDNLKDFDSEGFQSADVAIEFTNPKAALPNVLSCFAKGKPVVSGSTGWSDKLPDVRKLCDTQGATLLWSSNFSLGVNIFMMVNRFLAGIMDKTGQYGAVIDETHHVHKLDSPSGTAITLAEQLIEASPSLYDSWVETLAPGAAHEAPHADRQLPIRAFREGEVPGIHTVTWESPVDTITISHSAKSREGFALGAVVAAEWLHGRKGFFSMADVMADLIK